MYKIYREGNYIRVVDVKTNELFNGTVKEVFVDKNNTQKSVYKLLNVKGLPKDTIVSIPNIFKLDGTAYSKEEWETFYSENTGNFNGGGAAPETTENKVSAYTVDGTGTKYYSSDYVNETVEQIEQDIQSQLVGSTPLAASATLPPTGNFYTVGAGAGTYANWGGMVIPANNIGTLQRVNGVYSVSLTNVGFSVVDVLNSSSTTNSLSANQGRVLDLKIAQGIPEWTAKVYLSGDEVNYFGVDYISNTNTLSTDIPGTSNKWVERIKMPLLTQNTFPTKGFYSSSTNLFVSNSSWSTITISVVDAKLIRYSLVGGSGAFAISFFTAGNVFISGVPFTSSTPINGTIAVPSNASTANITKVDSIANTNFYTLLGDLSKVITTKASLTDDQTLAGINTFSVSPIVPLIPSTDAAATPRLYVDNSGAKPLITYTDFTERFFYIGSTKTLSENWCSQTVPVTAGEDVSYFRLHSASSANLVTFLNADNGVVSFVTQTGVLADEKNGTVVVPATATKVIFTTHLTYLSEASYKTRFNLKSIIPLDTTPPKTITVSKTLTANPATYIFNTIASALAIASGVDTLNIFEGTYNEYDLWFPNGIKVIGVGSVTIAGYLPSNSITTLVDAVSTINVKGITLENITVTGQNMRYPVHSDTGTGKDIQYISNCRFIHLGNYEVWNYRTVNATASPNTAAQTFRAMSAWGAGTRAGDKSYFKHCYFESPLRAFSTHNNVNFNLTFGASVTQLDDCEMVSHGIDFDNTNMNFCCPVVIQHLISNTDDKVILNNCRINGYIGHNLSSNVSTMSVVGGNNGNLKQVYNDFGAGKSMFDSRSLVLANRNYYEKFADEIENRKNRSTTTIPIGCAVKKTTNGGIELMTSADSTTLFFGVAMQDILAGKSGDVKTKGYLIRPYLTGLNSTTINEGDAISVKSDGTFEKSTTKIVMYGADNQNVIVKM